MQTCISSIGSGQSEMPDMPAHDEVLRRLVASGLDESEARTLLFDVSQEDDSLDLWIEKCPDLPHNQCWPEHVL